MQISVRRRGCRMLLGKLSIIATALFISYRVLPSLFRLDSHKCLELWILEGSIAQNCHLTSRALDVVLTWANGSDPLYSNQRQQYYDVMLAQTDSRATLRVGEPVEVDRRKHQRDHGELSFSLAAVRKYVSYRNAYLVVSDFFIDGFWQQSVPAVLPEGVQVVGTSQILPHDRLPVFNSLSIESHLGDVPGLSPIAVYLNDDTFFTRSHSTSDFHTVLTGPHFHISREILVSYNVSAERRNEYQKSEWSSLWYTNKLLSGKFGARERGYVEHIAKVFNRAVMQEVVQVFAEEISQSDNDKFRNGEQLNMMFLATWYTIEMLRTTLLKTIYDVVLEGDLRNIFTACAIDQDLVRERPQIDVLLALSHSAILPPLVSSFDVTFLNGYPFDHTSIYTGSECEIATRCIYPDKGIGDVDWIAFGMPSCGDCILRKILKYPGLARILPRPDSTRYIETLDDIKRYMWSITTTNFTFINIKTPAALHRQAIDLKASPIAQLCLNDDQADISEQDTDAEVTAMIHDILSDLL